MYFWGRGRRTPRRPWDFAQSNFGEYAMLEQVIETATSKAIAVFTTQILARNLEDEIFVKRKVATQTYSQQIAD